MKPNKNTIKVIKEFSILIDKLIELKKVSTPVPEYRKSSTFSEAFDKVKKEEPILKNAYEEIEKNITLTECLNSKKPFDNLYKKFYTEFGELKEKEIKYTVRIDGEEYEIDKPIGFSKNGIYTLKRNS